MRMQVWTLAAVLLAGAPASAQGPLTLQFDNGRVTLSAHNVPVKSILNEWARVGGSAVVNADRVAGGPVTIEFVGVPERQALDILLRSVPGYVLGPRASDVRGASAFDRILILPNSAAPAYVGPGTAVPAAAAERPRPVVPEFLARRPDLGVEGPRPPQPANGQPRRAGIFGPDFRDNPPPLPGAPPADDAASESADATGEPAAPVVATPTNPFGVPAGSSSTPGPAPLRVNP